MSKRCVILSAGDFNPRDYTPESGDYLITADGGYAYAKEMGLVPALCIGDFDSLGYTPSDCPVTTLPVEKDCTDTDAAIRMGLEEGCDTFLLLGMLGGKRLSHTIANLQSLALLAKHHIPHSLVGEGIAVCALARGDTVQFTKEDNLHVSVLAITDTAQVDLTGLHYSGKDLFLTNRFPLGVSNSTEGKEGSIACLDGMVLVITEEKTG